MVTKKDIVIELAKEFGLTQVATKKIVQGTFDKIIQVIADNDRIELRNFGVFEVKKRAPRKARNPKTGEEVHVPEKYVVAFKPGRKMEELVEKAKGLAPSSDGDSPPTDMPAPAGATGVGSSSIDDDDDDDL